jgi:hypothetical protein
MVDKVALGQVFSEYFGCPCQSSFHQILHPHTWLLLFIISDLFISLIIFEVRELKLQLTRDTRFYFKMVAVGGWNFKPKYPGSVQCSEEGFYRKTKS